MEPIDREQALQALRQRKHTITEAWYQAIGRTGYVPLPADEIRAHLLEWVDDLISLLLAESMDRKRIEEVGAALASLHFVGAEALGGTLEVLGRELMDGLPEGKTGEIQARLATLLSAIAAGFFRQAARTILAEQEETRNALVTELRATERQVRRAHDQLEARVQERTAELARANEGLRAEIAERQRAEQALQQSEERWRSLVENAPDLVVNLDRTGRILFLNRLPEIALISIEQIIGRDLLEYVHAEHRPAVREAIEAAFEGHRTHYLEVPIPSSYRGLAWYAVRLGPVFSEGRVVSVMAVARDISEERKVQELKDNLIRDVSHELRSPLAKVRMSLDLLTEVVEAEEVDRERAVRIGQLATRSVNRLLQTVEGILDLTRLEYGTWSSTTEAIEVEDLVAEVLEYLGPVARSKNLRVTVDMPDEPLPVVEGDRERLFRVLLNLLDNAIKFTAEGQIVISAVCRDGAVEVAVADTGAGMEAEVLERVFDRFYQERSQTEGVGIGLTICKAVVEAHGGRIWGESPGQGRGATFRFTLPVAPEGGKA
jgi:PAS domain S-box-containing protein